METQKPLYGLNDASRQFSLKVKEVFCELNISRIQGDEAFYYRNIDGNFQGAVLTHVDDFKLTGTTDFVDEILSIVAYLGLIIFE